MKKSTIILSTLCLFLVFGCSTENDTINETSIDPNFRVFDYNAKEAGSFAGNRGIDDAVCKEADLLAGQYETAGNITVTYDDNDTEIIDDDNLIITYSTTGDWLITETHLSIGDCSEQEIPTTGSGNPKIGHFEHSSEHPEGTTEVVYMVSSDVVDIDGCYCFAAHAVVSSPTLGEETAWGKGTEFGGNSWAMYIESCLLECIGGEEEEEEPEEE